MENQIYVVPPEFIQQAWVRAGKFIEAGMAHAKGECTADQLKVYVVNREHYLMLYLEGSEVVGAVEFMFEDAPNDRIFYVNSIGGKVSKEHFNMMCEWAKQHGCTAVRGCVRESVARLMRIKHDVQPIYIMVEKRLS
jgi:hypothetical protein